MFRGLSLRDVLPDDGHYDDVIVDPHSDDQDHQSKGLAKLMFQTFSHGFCEYFLFFLTDRSPDKVVLDSAEVVAPGDEEHGPDEDHTDLVEDGASCGGHLLGHGDT